MKTFALITAVLLSLTGCSTFQGGADAPAETHDSIRVHGTTGLGVGSDTATQTGIDSGTKSGSGLR
ncbi:MAG TPA: hypothetical protein VEH04_08405 [Verrucomicrobiae bacterium]|nr:hypothetical protein [Verrucomicrobiae bacterium]